MAVSRRVAIVAAVVSVMGLLTCLPSQAQPRQHARSRLHWARCASADLRAVGARCATLRVPLDYSRPAGASITLALARVRHSVPASRYKGVMLTNPGGPGSAGRYLAGIGAYVPRNAGAAYDWIGIDPRGVGASRPAVSCNTHYFTFNRPNYDPSRPANLQAWRSRTKRFAAACGRNNGAILEHMTTADSARDLNAIRMALGAQKINFYGFSYGTYLGQVYATLFPTHIARMVLDSNVNPTRIWYGANLDQDRAFQRNSTIWFRWLARYNAVYHLGSTEHAVEQRWYRIRSRLAKHADHGIGPDEWTDVFLDAEYYQSTWLNLAHWFAGYVHRHDYKAIRSAYAAAHNEKEFAAYNAVQCTDAQWPKSWHTWAHDNSRVNKKAPFETWANAWFNAPCLYWPAPAHPPVTITGNGKLGALLIDETNDAATPYSGSLEVRNLFRRSRLIALPGGTSHANSLFGDACLDNRIAAYLKSGRLPPRKPGTTADAKCAPLPRPRP
ncbi:MAG TPA: alpha/beta fold hydrolase [Jatrophihabitantaceae bacterium]|jgi:pimeloyl-ACP methyl ester carboxylesterase|nr:alpha/beta fold hydrolase [Jatrophihabitantaceae bacterium]